MTHDSQRLRFAIIEDLVDIDGRNPTAANILYNAWPDEQFIKVKFLNRFCGSVDKDAA